jgi:hypothetical protein
MAKDRLIIAPERFSAPPRGARIRGVITESIQHGVISPESATQEGCSVRRIAGRVKHGAPPLFLEFRGKPTVLLCTPDRESIRLPAENLTKVREVYSAIKSCAGGDREGGRPASPALLGKCVLRVAKEYGVEPVGKKRVLDGLRRAVIVRPKKRKRRR